MMKIIKVMNNSLILAINDSGNECILMGKGIGYKKSIGHDINDDEVEKTFILKDKTMLRNFIQLASELDDIYFNLVKDTIEYAINEFEIDVMDYLYLSLSDHIAFAVNRLKEGQYGTNFNYVEVVKYHKNEYAIGKYAVNLVNKTLGIKLPESEISAIGLHFVNARMNSKSYNKEVQVVKLVDHIELIVQRKLNMYFDRESLSYSRFITHLKYFAERIIEKQTFTNEDSDILYNQLIQNMTKENEIVESIAWFVNSKHQIKLSKQEKLYLVIHIHRILGGSK